MNNTKFVLSIVLGFTVLAVQSNTAKANFQDENALTATVTDITEFATAEDLAYATPTPAPILPAPGGDLPDPGGVLPLPNNNSGGGGFGGGLGCIPGIDCPSSGGRIDIGTILTLGQKVFDFIVTNKPNAEYQTLKAAVLPGGATNFTQLKGWSRPVSKLYHVEFKNLVGKSAGGFDYLITLVTGGSYQGKGKYIGQIAFTPKNILLKTDRQLNIHVELLDPLNYGTEDDPIAAAQMLITWHSPTTLRYTMNSIEYFIYGTGEIQDISNGTFLNQ